MALPPGMPTVTFEFGPYSDLAGDDSYSGSQGYAVAVHPETHKPVEVRHIDTGEVFTTVPVVFVLDSTGAGSVGPLAKPNTGETSPDNFAIAISFPAYGPGPKDRIVAVPEGADDVLDYDELVDAEPEPALSVPLAASLAQVAEAITLSQAAAQAAAVDAEAAAGASIAAAASSAAAISTANDAVTTADAAAADATAAVTTAGSASTAAATAVTTSRNAFVGASIVGDNLVLVDSDNDQTVAGNVRGPQGIQGLTGDMTPATQSPSVSGTGDLASAGYTPPTTRRFTLSGNLTLINLPQNPGPTRSCTLTIVFVQAATGGPFTVTWPALSSLPWAGGAPAPTMPTAASSRMVVHLFWDGVSWTAYLGAVFP